VDAVTGVGNQILDGAAFTVDDFIKGMAVELQVFRFIADIPVGIYIRRGHFQFLI
jgi:hypothetical protein